MALTRNHSDRHAAIAAISLLVSLLVISVSSFTLSNPCLEYREGRTVRALAARGISDATTSFNRCRRPIRQESFAMSYPKSTRLNESEQAGIDSNPGKKRPLPIRRAFLLSSLLAGAQFLFANAYALPGFERIPTQFMAALGDPDASQGTGAKEWGLWEVDPGPRGVWLRNYQSQLVDNNNKAPAGWTFDKNDWWLEEHGLIMEAPKFPVAPGRYLVTGGRLVTTGLTIDEEGAWKLDDGKLYDVTHLPCRSARYTPSSKGGSPLMARQSDFPVTPGAEMPKVQGCNKQDYAVLFVIGKEATKEL